MRNDTSWIELIIGIVIAVSIVLAIGAVYVTLHFIYKFW